MDRRGARRRGGVAASSTTGCRCSTSTTPTWGPVASTSRRTGRNRLARFELEIPAEVVEPLLASTGGSARAKGDTVADLLVAGLAAAVVGWRRDRGIDAPGALFTLEGHGRQEGVVDVPVDLSRTVGWFTSMFPTHVDLDGRTAVDMLDDPDVAAAVVAATRAAMAAHPDRGIGYGMLRYLDEEGRDRLAGSPSRRSSSTTSVRSPARTPSRTSARSRGSRTSRAGGRRRDRSGGARAGQPHAPPKRRSTSSRCRR